jgi:hypothetical protein
MTILELGEVPGIELNPVLELWKMQHDLATEENEPRTGELRGLLLAAIAHVCDLLSHPFPPSQSLLESST